MPNNSEHAYDGGGCDVTTPAGERLATLEVTGMMQGQRIKLSLVIDVRKIPDCLGWLADHGFISDNAGQGWERTADGAPICPRHRTAMRRREKQGDQWHSHIVRTEDGGQLYCRGYAGPDSPGFYWDDVTPRDTPTPEDATREDVTNHKPPAKNGTAARKGKRT